MNSTGADAKTGTASNKGTSGIASRKYSPMKIAVRPVRPPASTPANDSASTMTGPQPMTAETTEPIAHVKKTAWAPGRPAASARAHVMPPTSISTMIPRERIERASEPASTPSSTPKSTAVMRPIQPTAVASTIGTMTAVRQLMCCMTAMQAHASPPMMTGPRKRGPLVTPVVVEGTTSPIIWQPSRASSSPRPMGIASLIEDGVSLNSRQLSVRHASTSKTSDATRHTVEMHVARHIFGQGIGNVGGAADSDAKRYGQVGHEPDEDRRDRGGHCESECVRGLREAAATIVHDFGHHSQLVRLGLGLELE
eukprot:scaffold1620_cov68-Phaeocystis_antarctica.AAC.3